MVGGERGVGGVLVWFRRGEGGRHHGEVVKREGGGGGGGEIDLAANRLPWLYYP